MTLTLTNVRVRRYIKPHARYSSIIFIRFSATRVLRDPAVRYILGRHPMQTLFAASSLLAICVAALFYGRHNSCSLAIMQCTLTQHYDTQLIRRRFRRHLCGSGFPAWHTRLPKAPLFEELPNSAGRFARIPFEAGGLAFFGWHLRKTSPSSVLWRYLWQEGRALFGRHLRQAGSGHGTCDPDASNTVRKTGRLLRALNLCQCAISLLNNKALSPLVYFIL